MKHWKIEHKLRNPSLDREMWTENKPHVVQADSLASVLSILSGNPLEVSSLGLIHVGVKIEEVEGDLPS